MRSGLLLLMAVSSTCISAPLPPLTLENDSIHQNTPILGQAMAIISPNLSYEIPSLPTIDEIKAMLVDEGNHLSPIVINKVLSTIQCANEHHLNYNPILSVIDYSLPSSEKRLWVFDLVHRKLLFHTYVSHGIKSGLLLTNNFSNVNNSKATSIGVYKTQQAYYGRDGLSLRLSGLDRGFNDNASNRAIVMHGGWYVEEQFIKKYGRAGRSWGCPAVPLLLSRMIINTIKDNSLFVAYYPHEQWFASSKFLKCDKVASDEHSNALSIPQTKEPEHRDSVLFAENQRSKRLDEKGVIAVSADDYAQIFRSPPPLTRMLRRQINHEEYIALSNTEFNNIVISHNKLGLNEVNDHLKTVYLVTPRLKMTRGYYETEMHISNLGKIKDVLFNKGASESMDQINSYTVHFEKNALITLKPTDQFIRWIGL